MSYKDQINHLFKEWKNSNPEYQRSFVKDGIVNRLLF